MRCQFSVVRARQCAIRHAAQRSQLITDPSVVSCLSWFVAEKSGGRAVLLPDPVASETPLPAQPEFPDQSAVPLDIFSFEVLEKALPTAYQAKKTPPGSMITFVRFKVFGELRDPCRHDADLDLGRPGVRVGPPVILNDGRLLSDF